MQKIIDPYPSEGALLRLVQQDLGFWYNYNFLVAYNLNTQEHEMKSASLIIQISIPPTNPQTAHNTYPRRS